MAEEFAANIKLKSEPEGISARMQAFRDGMRDALPVGMGYLAVSFSLGITARTAGLAAGQGFLASMVNNTSAGEFAAFAQIALNASYLEVALVTLIANARYMLMSCALSQKLAPGLPLRHRLLIGFDVTDELFGLFVARPGVLEPFYAYGAFLTTIPCWAAGTAMGISAGNVLPAGVVSALSVALYGMFLAVIIPPARSEKIIGVLVLISFAASWLASSADIFAGVSSGTRIIILTAAIAAAAALLFPVKEDDGHDA